MEGSFKSVDPLAYYVNNVSDFDADIVGACKRKDVAEIQRLAARGKEGSASDIFICVSKSWHGFVLCVPAKTDPAFEDMITDVIKTPFDVPGMVLCSIFELCYEDERLQTYKIRKTFDLFKNIEGRIKRSFFIGHYEEISLSGLQICAIHAAPHRYAVLLEDCVEYSKEFCLEALRFCSNGKAIERDVNKNIKAATASGFSFEHLSRNVKSSAWFGNVLLNSPDLSSFFSRRYPNILILGICLVVVLFLVYPVIVVIVYNRIMNEHHEQEHYFYQ